MGGSAWFASTVQTRQSRAQKKEREGGVVYSCTISYHDSLRGEDGWWRMGVAFYLSLSVFHTLLVILSFSMLVYLASYPYHIALGRGECAAAAAAAAQSGLVSSLVLLSLCSLRLWMSRGREGTRSKANERTEVSALPSLVITFRSCADE